MCTILTNITISLILSEIIRFLDPKERNKVVDPKLLCAWVRLVTNTSWSRDNSLDVLGLRMPFRSYRSLFEVFIKWHLAEEVQYRIFLIPFLLYYGKLIHHLQEITLYMYTDMVKLDINEPYDIIQCCLILDSLVLFKFALSYSTKLHKRLNLEAFSSTRFHIICIIWTL